MVLQRREALLSGSMASQSKQCETLATPRAGGLAKKRASGGSNAEKRTTC